MNTNVKILKLFFLISISVGVCALSSSPSSAMSEENIIPTPYTKPPEKRKAHETNPEVNSSPKRLKKAEINSLFLNTAPEAKQITAMSLLISARVGLIR